MAIEAEAELREYQAIAQTMAPDLIEDEENSMDGAVAHVLKLIDTGQFKMIDTGQLKHTRAWTTATRPTKTAGIGWTGPTASTLRKLENLFIGEGGVSVEVSGEVEISSWL